MAICTIQINTVTFKFSGGRTNYMFAQFVEDIFELNVITKKISWCLFVSEASCNLCEMVLCVLGIDDVKLLCSAILWKSDQD